MVRTQLIYFHTE